MNDTALDALALRVDLLERKLWKWKVAVVIIGAALAALAGMVIVTFLVSQSKQSGLAKNREVAARKFVVVNEAGEAVATLGSWGNGAMAGLVLIPSLAAPSSSKQAEKSLEGFFQPLADRGGGVFVAGNDEAAVLLGARHGIVGPDFGADLSAGRRGARLHLNAERDKDGRAAGVSLAASTIRYQQAEVSVSSPGGRKASLQASDAHQGDKHETPGTAGVSLSEPWGFNNPRPPVPRGAEFTLKSDGSAGLKFSAENDRAQAGLGVDKDGGPHLNLFDSNGKLRTALGVADLQTATTGAGEKPGTSSLTLFDKEGKAIWQSPK